MTESDAKSHRFVVVAPVGRDRELICAFVVACGFSSEPAASLSAIAAVDSNLLLGLILTDEALGGEGLRTLRTLANSNNGWADLPLILLTSSTDEPVFAATATQLCKEHHGVILLDRPVRKELLLNAVQVACNSRLCQWTIREATARQMQSEEALRSSEKLAATGRLVATMAHEVSNPMEALSNLLFLVENSNTLDEAQSFSRMASRELGRISEIISHTLHFHRAAANPALTDVAELASSALMLFRGKMRAQHIVERIALNKAFAYCSEGEIRQSLVNLIGNAIDAMPNGGTLQVRVSMITMGNRQCARVTVADTGKGIPREVRSKLFTQFFTTKGSSGTGLGLWLTRDIVQRNSGALRYRSRTEAPSGTVFSIYLPATQGQPASQESSDRSADVHTLAGAA